jgi:hypothetical protein
MQRWRAEFFTNAHTDRVVSERVACTPLGERVIFQCPKHVAIHKAFFSKISLCFIKPVGVARLSDASVPEQLSAAAENNSSRANLPSVCAHTLLWLTHEGYARVEEKKAYVSKCQTLLGAYACIQNGLNHVAKESQRVSHREEERSRVIL